MCLWSSHLPHYSESFGSKRLGTLIPLLKSSLQLLTGVLKEASFPLVIFMWFTSCYFLISTSYSKGTLFCLRGRTPLGNINTYKLICFHRLEEEKTGFFFMFYICKTYVKRVFVSYRTNKYWLSSCKCTQAGDDETGTLCFIQGKCVLSVDYSLQELLLYLCFLAYFCYVRLYILYPSNLFGKNCQMLCVFPLVIF